MVTGRKLLGMDIRGGYWFASIEETLWFFFKSSPVEISGGKNGITWHYMNGQNYGDANTWSWLEGCARGQKFKQGDYS